MKYMNNKKKDGMTPFMRGLAILLAAAMVASLGIFAQDAYVKASEEVGEDGIVREVADEVVEPEPAPEPEPVEVVEEIVIELPEPEPEAVEEPAPEVGEEPAPEEEPEAPAEETPVEAAPVEEAPAEVEAPAEEAKEAGITDEDFDVEKAYEHYMKLDDAGKEEYLDSLNDEHRKALEDYIAAKEAPVEEVEEAEEAAPTEENEELPAEEAEQPAEEVTEGETENAEAPAEKVEETPAEKAEPEAAAAEEEPGFSSAYLSGKWAGRETSTPRNVDLTVVKDGEVVDRRVVSYNMSVLDVTVAAGDCEVTDVQCSCYTFSGSGSAYTIDMYQDTNVTFSVELTSPAAEEAPAEEIEEAPAEEVEEPAEEVTEDEAENEEVPAEEPAEEFTEEPVEEKVIYTYLRDEEGNLVLDERGNPTVEAPEGADIPVAFQRDEEGNLVLDEEGNPIPSQYVPANAVKINSIDDVLDPDRYVDIYASWEGDELYSGDEITLYAVIFGYDKAEYELQWQTSPDNETWEDIEGETGAEMKVIATEENFYDYFRVWLTVTGISDMEDGNAKA